MPVSLKIPGVAPHRFDGTLEAAPLPRLFPALHVAVDGRYVAAMPADDVNRVFSPPYAVGDMRMWYAPRGAQWISPFAGASNIFDREYNTSVVINAAGGRYFEPGPGRVFYVGLEGRLARTR